MLEMKWCPRELLVELDGTVRGGLSGRIGLLLEHLLGMLHLGVFWAVKVLEGPLRDLVLHLYLRTGEGRFGGTIIRMKCGFRGVSLTGRGGRSD